MKNITFDSFHLHSTYCTGKSKVYRYFDTNGLFSDYRIILCLNCIFLCRVECAWHTSIFALFVPCIELNFICNTKLAYIKCKVIPLKIPIDPKPQYFFTWSILIISQLISNRLGTVYTIAKRCEDCKYMTKNINYEPWKTIHSQVPLLLNANAPKFSNELICSWQWWW